eukprot:CAMPEP_0185561070 /NCGR_PEP_ID=MMETSP1381-20130426/58357_1 /TAXON_ID=298111 /ORGANISM="Pavlova sp., Strain CCMP459" /LENGTH=62 /DNA_ID=CAMNT_0028174821 /DNA_START=326 /DNA_END=514 /DNA_ORIENTATION=-
MARKPQRPTSLPGAAWGVPHGGVVGPRTSRAVRQHAHARRRGKRDADGLWRARRSRTAFGDD